MYMKLKKLYSFFFVSLPTFWYCLISGLTYQKTWQLQGGVKLIKRNWLMVKLLHQPNGTLTIGSYFKCNNRIKSNSIGLIQPCVFNISTPGSRLTIGNNVGISGSSICATTSVTIGDNVLVGSGCLITDTDAHPVNYLDRRENKPNATLSKPIVIGNDVFIGARSIILKGVTIGDRAVIGAGSVVTQGVPSDCIVAGNPARVVRHLEPQSN